LLEFLSFKLHSPDSSLSLEFVNANLDLGLPESHLADELSSGDLLGYPETSEVIFISVEGGNFNVSHFDLSLFKNSDGFVIH